MEVSKQRKQSNISQRGIRLLANLSFNVPLFIHDLDLDHDLAVFLLIPGIKVYFKDAYF